MLYHSSNSKPKCLWQISCWYSEIILVQLLLQIWYKLFLQFVGAGGVCPVRELCNYSFIGVHQQKTMQKCVSICKFESLSQISRWYSEIIKYNCCSRYGTNYFCNLLARAGCAQCTSFVIIHSYSLGFIGRKLCRNAVSIDSQDSKPKCLRHISCWYSETIRTTAAPDMVQTIFAICQGRQGVQSARVLQLFIHWGSLVENYVEIRINM